MALINENLTGKAKIKVLVKEDVERKKVPSVVKYSQGRYVAVRRLYMTQEEYELLKKKGIDVGGLIRMALKAKRIIFEYE